ncbi:hypothetical protein F5Y09DRAFT_319680 [Xylaria sp. FL1042]|nr:hypothetical protein F5Y09DRAFT_319680 [Xylaria sp. FL1042]
MYVCSVIIVIIGSIECCLIWPRHMRPPPPPPFFSPAKEETSQSARQSVHARTISNIRSGNACPPARPSAIIIVQEAGIWR